MDRYARLGLEVLCREIGVEPKRRVLDMEGDELIELFGQIDHRKTEIWREQLTQPEKVADVGVRAMRRLTWICVGLLVTGVVVGFIMAHVLR